MPTYEYECTNGHTFEVVQRITAEPLKRCTVCRSKVTRLISATNFILKGRGWYSDGYSSSKNGGKNDSQSSTSSSSSESKSSSSKDSSTSSSESKSSSSKDSSASSSQSD